jgi:tetratricopeptide (TPR) repeat protein
MVEEEYAPEEHDHEVGPLLSIFGIAAAAAGLWLFAQANDSYQQTPPSYEAHQLTLQAQALVSQGRLSDALSTLERAIELDPYHSISYGLMAWVLSATGQLQHAFGYAQRALELADNPAERAQALYLQGEVCVRAQDWDEGITRLRDCLKLISDLPSSPGPQACFLLGICYKAKGLQQDAIQFLEQAFQFDPANADAAAALGEIYLFAEQYHRAIIYYQQALQALGNNQILSQEVKGALLSTYYLHIGVAFYHLEDINESWKHFFTAYQTCKFNPFALVNLAGICAKRNQPIQMRFYLEHAMPLLYDSPYFPGSQLVNALLQEPEFEPYRDKVLGLLVNQNLISQMQYRQVLTTWQQRQTAGTKHYHLNNAQIGVLNADSSIQGHQEGWRIF